MFDHAQYKVIVDALDDPTEPQLVDAVLKAGGCPGGTLTDEGSRWLPVRDCLDGPVTEMIYLGPSGGYTEGPDVAHDSNEGVPHADLDEGAYY